jgi:FAD synthase
MAKRSVLTIRVPEDLKLRMERLAQSQGVSLNQLALYAFSKEASEIETQMFFSRRLGSRSRTDLLRSFDVVMATVPARDVLDESDRL